jgi:hypothetical protein
MVSLGKTLGYLGFALIGIVLALVYLAHVESTLTLAAVLFLGLFFIVCCAIRNVDIPKPKVKQAGA